jgi:hypothetical protein
VPFGGAIGTGKPRSAIPVGGAGTASDPDGPGAPPESSRDADGPGTPAESSRDADDPGTEPERSAAGDDDNDGKDEAEGRDKVEAEAETPDSDFESGPGTPGPVPTTADPRTPDRLGPITRAARLKTRRVAVSYPSRYASSRSWPVCRRWWTRPAAYPQQATKTASKAMIKIELPGAFMP